jgi:ketosteroid isomerase-like protein
MGDPSIIVQNLYAAFGRGDVAGLLELLSDDVDWCFIGDRQAGYAGRVRGKAAVAEWLAQVARADDIQGFEPREFLAGADHVTVLGWERTIARSSGREFESDWVHVFGLRGGKVCRFVGALDSEASATAR